MKILFIVDPLPGLTAYKDTSVAMMRAMAGKGYELHVAYQEDLFLDGDSVMANALPITLVAEADLHGTAWWTQGKASDASLNSFDAVLMRKDPPFDMEYLYATHLLEQAERQGARVFNTGAALRNHPEKLSIAEFPQFIVPTLVSRSMARLRAFSEQHGDVIFKPLDGMGGTGVFRVQPGDPNRGSILEVLTDNEQRSIMAQRYIPEITQGDKRVIIIAGEPIPYVLARIPLAGETRGNLAAGGRGVAQPITEHDRNVALHIGQTLKDRGLLLIGLDMIGTHVTEINVTSPTCFVEITEQTGFDVAAHFVSALEAALAAPAPRAL